jgi:DNA-binding transcriptional regulator YhcF (GntR family)
VKRSRVAISPVQNAVWRYAEWCCDTGQPWPKLSIVAADLARNLREVQQAFRDLVEIGVITQRAGHGHQTVVRLGDGRETTKRNAA